MDEIVKEFVVECNERLDQLDRDLVELEKHPLDHELLARVFRAVHTIKGTSGALGYPRLEALTHAGENLLTAMRDGNIRLDAAIASSLLAMMDAVRHMLAAVAETEAEGDCDCSAIVEQLMGFVAQSAKNAAPPAPDQPAASAPPAAPVPQKKSQEEEEHAVPLLGEILVERGQVTPEQVAEAVREQQQGDPRRVGDILIANGAVAPEAVAEAAQVQARRRETELSQSSIRVDVGLLDKVMNLVGELVLARNQILQFTSSEGDAALLSAAQRLNLITTELQEGVMKARMQPIGKVWNNFPRIVRDLAAACAKEVRIEMEGADTELDKTLLEAIKDPLTHIIRNAVDHGIELPAQRQAAGKPAAGHLQLRAYHEGGKVIIEIADDGAGIALERVRQKAIANGLISPEKAARMSEREVLQLIFLPGLSTAQKVSNISGRGVGMDVVKTNIEKIGGTVEIQSTPGKGTVLKIKIPLTLAIIPALIVTSGGERFAIPQASLVELVRLDMGTAHNAIEMVDDVPVYRLRGNLLPLVFLNRELRRQSLSLAGNAAASLVVLQADDRQFGLVVDEIDDTEEIVVKPLGKQLKGTSSFAGGTIMGDGQVALILDVMGLAQRANVLAEAREHGAVRMEDQDSQEQQEHELWLVFRAGQDGIFALPLALVSRLEQLESSLVERAAGQPVVQYRGQIMPLIDIAKLLGGEESSAGQFLEVIVYSGNGRSVGLVVGEVLDIADENVRIEKQGVRAGLLGSAVIRERVTSILDIPGLLAAANLAPAAMEVGA
jgi:two-component system chemotaxis sensor kinase CheA